MRSWSSCRSSLVNGGAAAFDDAEEIGGSDLAALEGDLQPLMGRIVGMGAAQGRARRRGGERGERIDAEREARMAGGVAAGDDGALKAAFAQGRIEDAAEAVAAAVVDGAGGG